MEFIELQKAVSKKFSEMKNHKLFRTDASKDEMWETYLGSFPKGTNPIFRERTEHDCQCCKSFIRAIGNVVAIVDGKMVSIWDIEIDGFYQDVANAMSKLVKSKVIRDIFLSVERTAGVDKNYEDKGEGVKTWNHFFVNIPQDFVVRNIDIGTKMGNAKSSKEVFQRALETIDLESIDTVLELIAQNSLYRGEEHKFVIGELRKHKVAFNKLKKSSEKNGYCWLASVGAPESVCHIRNTSIGTLLVDLAEGKELEHAVKSFERIVAPANYKRPTALVTKAMVEKARKTIEELGFTSALERRYAHLNDISINNILYADRNVKSKLKGGNVFELVKDDIKDSIKNLDKVEEVGIEKFLKDILPSAESIEVMFENKHVNNLVSLVAPVDPEAKLMFKWGNAFSWSYNGDMADSIKERVKKAGGAVDGDLRCSLSWFNHDDLDLHMHEPNGYTIYFGNRYNASPNKGKLDVDMNAGYGSTREPVENITYPSREHIKEGIYTLKVHNFCKRESQDVGFTVEVEFDGVIHTFNYAKAVQDKQYVEVAQIKYSKKNGFEIVKSIESTQTAKNIWNISTQKFHKVASIMLSPNYWDEKAVGNKHYFFMLDSCMNEGQARGFFNEFLNEDLNKHRKVLEVVGSRMKTEGATDQLSGVGFSSTQRNSIFCKVTGKFTRTIKILF